MAQVSIVMGSDSDMPVMAKAAEILDKFGISYEMRIISAHRMPDTFLAEVTAVCADGTRIGLIRDGFFVLDGTEELNLPLYQG